MHNRLFLNLHSEEAGAQRPGTPNANELQGAGSDWRALSALLLAKEGNC